MKNLIESIDWDSLKKQKNTLLNLSSSDILTSDIIDDLYGLINLIDSIQDYAVDDFGMDENKIYDLTQ